MVEYTVAFDVIQSGYRNWWFAAGGLVFVVIGTLLVRFRDQLPQRTPGFFPFFFLGFAILWTVIAFVGTLAGYLSLASALRQGRCEVVEGVVSDFHLMPYSGKEMEWFVCDDRRFEYSDYRITAGFNNTASHGGPIRKGLRVRVHHVDYTIARLEIAR